MTLFDRYIAVDWSAAAVPRLGRDSIWVGEWGDGASPHVASEIETSPHPDPLLRGERGRRPRRVVFSSPLPSGERDRVRGRLAPSLNLPTRTLAMQHVASRLLRALDAGERVLVGWDFGFGYPAGTAAALTGAADWRGVWALVADRLVDGEDNANNRFEVAAALNRQLGAELFWGHPAGRRYDGLGPRRTAAGYGAIAERRGVERLTRGVQPMWKLSGVGAVGSQSLTGIARLERLRQSPELAGTIAVWPFETNFAAAAGRPIWLVEMYPSLFALEPEAAEPKDRAQVEAAVRSFAALDAAGRLGAFLAPADGLGDAEAAVALGEEGWIAGAGHGAMLRAEAPA